MEKIILFVTGNQTKVLHANEALKKYGYKVVSQKLHIIEPREEEPEKVVVEKTVQAFAVLNKTLIMEDSGIFIRALNGFPKTFIHFVQDTIGVGNIVKMMKGVKDRYAEYRQSLAYLEPGMLKPKVFSYVDGNYTVAEKVYKPKYESGEFDKILIPPGQKVPACMFTKDWRARRDTEANKETIHYRQLAQWLDSRQTP